jgi:hypothetical protein
MTNSVVMLDLGERVALTERAERIGAELLIQSHPGQGTDIIVRIQMP